MNRPGCDLPRCPTSVARPGRCGGAQPSVVLGVNRSYVLDLVEASGQAARNLLRIVAARVRHDNIALSSVLPHLEFEQVALIDVKNRVSA